LAGNPLRAAITVLAVGLGVAIALAVDLANATAVASFASSVNVVSNHVNLQVLGVGRGFDDRTILRVQDVPGVLFASPKSCACSGWICCGRCRARPERSPRRAVSRRARAFPIRGCL
jgi:hypothetical protein